MSRVQEEELKGGEIELWIFCRRLYHRTNLCGDGGEFLASAISSTNVAALFINNEEVSEVNIKKAEEARQTNQKLKAKNRPQLGIFKCVVKMFLFKTLFFCFN